MGLNTTPHTFTINELVTAATMNLEVRDAFIGLQAAWTAYTPTWTSSGAAPAVGNGTLTGKYLRIGKTIHYEIHLVAGSTTSFGGGRLDFGLPVPHNNANYDVLGRATCRDTSALLTYARTAVAFSGTDKVHLIDQSGNLVDAATPFTWANTDRLNISGTYEAA